jgi:peptidoglycan/xylan/chitin deacetylase (PgdA/CDA1 family)
VTHGRSRDQGRRGWGALVVGVAFSAQALIGGGAVIAAVAVGTAADAGVAQAAAVPLFYTGQAPNVQPPGGAKDIALTFDDGPDPTWTPQVLAVLEQHHIPATFFEIGQNVAAHPAVTAEVAAAGYPVEDHTYTHPDLATLSAAGVAAQISQTQQVITSVTGIAPTCLRPPYDSWNQSVLNDINGAGLSTMSYSIDPRDWALPGVASIIHAVVGGAFPGAVVDMHDAGGNRAETVAALPQIISDLQAQGYTFVSICGNAPPPPPPPPPPPDYQTETYNFGTANAPVAPILSTSPLVGSAVTTDGNGYWYASATGQVFAQGDAGFYGDLTGVALSKPIVGMAATPDGHGYWLVASDGGVFAFGDAGFYGSTGNLVLNQPVVGIADDPATGGYWLLARDGGIFAFSAPFFGSMGGTPLNQPMVGMTSTPDGNGYTTVAADGGIFAFGGAQFYGSTGGIALNQPVVGMAGDSATGGYWLVAADGGVFNFNAPFAGSQGGSGVPGTFFGLLPVNAGTGYFLVAQVPVTAPT